MVTCPKCSYQNKAADRYCINCAEEIRSITKAEKGKAEQIENERREYEQRVKALREFEEKYKKDEEFQELKKKCFSEKKICLKMKEREVEKIWGTPSKVITMADGSIAWKYLKLVLGKDKKEPDHAEDVNRYVIFRKGLVFDFRDFEAEGD